jgi:hypothetical protein
LAKGGAPISRDDILKANDILDAQDEAQAIIDERNRPK